MDQDTMMTASQRSALHGASEMALPEVSVPIWEVDSSSCSVCSKPFGFGLKSRHHCRTCGRCVCDPCSPNRVQLGGPCLRLGAAAETAPVRVCSLCIQNERQHKRDLLESFLDNATALANAEARIEELRRENEMLKRERARGRPGEHVPVRGLENAKCGSTHNSSSSSSASQCSKEHGDGDEKSSNDSVTQRQNSTSYLDMRNMLREKGKSRRNVDDSDEYRTFDSIRGVVALGCEARGANADGTYRVGDMARGLLAHRSLMKQ